jgi:hypothetical protein
MALLGIGVTGAAATTLTVVLAGLVFASVVAGATVAASITRRRRSQGACTGAPAPPGPVPVELGFRPEES